MTALPTELESLLSKLDVIQKLVEMQVSSLREFREKRDTKSDLILQERNNIEGKLMKFFAKQIVTKIEFGPNIAQIENRVNNYPKVEHFLYVVDVADDMTREVTERCSSVEQLCLFTDEKIRGIFYSHDDDEQLSQKLNAQSRRLSMAIKILKSYVERLQNGEKVNDLTWNSWFDTISDSPSPNIRASITSYLSLFSYSSSDDLFRAKPFSIPAISSRSIPPSPITTRNIQTIPRSKSDERDVGQRVHMESTSSISSISTARKRIKSHTPAKQKPKPLIIIPNPETETDSDLSKSRSSSLSQSPRTPNATWNFSMGHSIKHRFTNKQLLVSMTCDYCNRIMFVGVKCKECGFKCHKKCSRKAPPSCGLPEQMEDAFRQVYKGGKLEGIHSIKRTNSEPSDIIHQVTIKHDTLPVHRSHGNLHHQAKEALCSVSMHSGDSYSTNSSTSSMSSSPFHGDSPVNTPDFQSANLNMNYLKVDAVGTSDSRDLVDSLVSTTSTISTIKSDASTDTLTMVDSEHSKSSSTETNGTESTISQDDSPICSVDDLHMQISDVIPQHVRLRERGSLMSEWVIPYQDIEVGDLIGTGRIGKVHKARWHGECALKILYLENPSIEEKNSFKYKVQVLRRTRHENLILFMGACMEPPTLAILCSLCKGYTLYAHIHVHGTKFEDAKLISIIQQIAQGMSYLHAKGIVHCDLKSKNIFIENNKVIITDFGFLSVGDIANINSKNPGFLRIPRGWLCYQAPEIIRLLKVRDPGGEVPFYTKQSDVFAFGTVWFELIAGTWPFRGMHNETVIWQIGKGYNRQQLAWIEISREAKKKKLPMPCLCDGNLNCSIKILSSQFKIQSLLSSKTFLGLDILSVIWAYQPEDRPVFRMLIKVFERLPKRKLIRSPSQPTYLTRALNLER